MRDLTAIPEAEKIIEHVKVSKAKTYSPSAENDRTTIKFEEGYDTAIAHLGENHDIYIAWSNEVPVYGDRQYRLIVLAEIRNEETIVHAHFFHGATISIVDSRTENKLIIWGCSVDADIFNAYDDDDTVVNRHFKNVFWQFIHLHPRENAENILNFYDNKIVASWNYGLHLEIEGHEDEDEDGELITP